MYKDEFGVGQQRCAQGQKWYIWNWWLTTIGEQHQFIQHHNQKHIRTNNLTDWWRSGSHIVPAPSHTESHDLNQYVNTYKYKCIRIVCNILKQVEFEKTKQKKKHNIALVTSKVNSPTWERNIQMQTFIKKCTGVGNRNLTELQTGGLHKTRAQRQNPDS